MGIENLGCVLPVWELKILAVYCLLELKIIDGLGTGYSGIFMSLWIGVCYHFEVNSVKKSPL